jgi:hypothetical protein
MMSKKNDLNTTVSILLALLPIFVIITIVFLIISGHLDIAFPK